MNNLTPSEEFLKEHVGSYDYPYDGISWSVMEKSLRRRSFFKFMKWSGGIAVFTAAVVSVICLTDKKQECFNKISPDHKTYSQNIHNSENTDEPKIVTNGNDVSENNGQSKNQNSINPVISEYVNHDASRENDSVKTVVKKDDLLTRTHSKSPNPEFSLSDNSGCPPFTVGFYPSEKCDSMIYSWDFGDGKISTDKQPVHTYKKSGKYTVRLMVKYFRSDEMKTKVFENAIVVFPEPKSDIDISVDRNFVSMQATAQENKCTWISGDSVSNGNTAERVFMKNGKYKVTLILQNDLGCADTLAKSFEINVPLVVYMPTTFTPFKEGPNQFFGPSTNPDVVNFQMEIINSRGQIVYSKTGKEVNWDGYNQQNNQPCEPGLYHYKLKIWDKFGNFEQKNGSIIF